jgi:hypothetical protein
MSAVPTLDSSLDALRAGAPRVEPPSLERILTAPEYFGLTTATPVQRSICRVADGLPLGDFAYDPVVQDALGDVSQLGAAPLEMYVLSGSRVGKTRWCAAAAVRMSQTVDVRGLTPGDEPRIPILSLDKDKAHACYLHLTEGIKASPELRSLIVAEGRNELGSAALWLRHPSGRPIQVCVAAGKRAGNAVVSYFLAGCIFDEFGKMYGADESVVNFDDSRRNALGRLLPGAKLLAIGSTWAPFGPAYDAAVKHHRRPTRDLVVVRVKGRHMNPSWWTPERIASLPPDVAATEEGAEFREPEEALLSDIVLRACTREAPLTIPREPGCDYVAAMDPATRGNAWTLAIATKKQARRVVVCARQWRGSASAPLDPYEVLRDTSIIVRSYGIDWVETDQWSTDTLAAVAARLVTVDLRERIPLRLVHWPATLESNTRMYLEVCDRAEARELELPPDDEVRKDLQRLKKVTTQAGVRIDLPKTGDGRHCDYAPVVARVLRRYVEDARPPAPQDGSREDLAKQQREHFENAKARFGRKPAVPFWKRTA